MTPELTQAQPQLSSNSGDTSERPSPGALIRRARERARMTPEELAVQTKLARGTLDALERDDFNILIEPVYVRGYYRKCSKVLDLSEKELLDAYEARVAPRAPALPAKLRLASGSELGTGGRLPIPLAVMGAVAAIVISGLIWLARGEINNTVPPAVSAKADAMMPESVIPASAVTALGAGVESTSAIAQMPVLIEPASTPAVSAPAASTQAPSAAASISAPVATIKPAPATGHSLPLLASQSLSSPKPPAPVATTPSVATASADVVTGGRATMTLDFSITSWARVDDASGKTLLNGLMRAGDKQTLNGATPFKVFLGNAPGVKAAVNGKSVDLVKYTAANNTARLSIGASKP